jgi:hypothetical protein
LEQNHAKIANIVDVTQREEVADPSMDVQAQLLKRL